MDRFVPRDHGVGCEHAHYKCYAYVQPERLAPGWSRERMKIGKLGSDPNCLDPNCFVCQAAYERLFCRMGL
jgi:hypothetical protein